MVNVNKDCQRHYACECYLDRISELEEALGEQIKLWTDMEQEIESDDMGDSGAMMTALGFIDLGIATAKEVL